MSKMFADIKRIVDEDISNRVNQIDVIFETDTNAVNANISLNHEYHFNVNHLNFE